LFYTRIHVLILGTALAAQSTRFGIRGYALEPTHGHCKTAITRPARQQFQASIGNDERERHRWCTFHMFKNVKVTKNSGITKSTCCSLTCEIREICGFYPLNKLKLVGYALEDLGLALF
jgi:hypothetical protein